MTGESNAGPFGFGLEDPFGSDTMEIRPDSEEAKVPFEFIAPHESPVNGAAIKCTTMRHLELSGSGNSESGPQIKIGELKKHSPAFLVNWQSRHVELSYCCLRYFKVEHSKKFLQGMINFDLYQCFVAKSTKSGKGQ